MARCRRDGIQRFTRTLGAGAILVILRLSPGAALLLVVAVRGRIRARRFHGVSVHDEALAFAGLTRCGECFNKALPHALTRHLHQTQRGDLSDLVASAVTSQALNQAAQDEVTVGFKHHIDKVDDDDAADVTQTQLTHDLFSGLQVVARDGFFQRAAGTNVLAGVDVDHRHRFGAVNNQRAAAGQPHLAVHALGQLFIDAELSEDVIRADPLFDAVRQFRRQLFDVCADCVIRVLALNNQLSEIFVEDVTHDADSQFGLAAHQRRGRLRVLLTLGDVVPLLRQALNIGNELFFGRTFGRGANNNTGSGRHDLLEDFLQASSFRFWQLAGNTHHGAVRNEDEVASGQRDLAGQAGTLVADRVFGDLHQHRVTGLECRFNSTRATFQAHGIPVDLTGIQDGISASANIDERSFHRRQHVLDATQVDVADHCLVGASSHVMLDQQVIFDHCDLIKAVMLANDHLAGD